MLSSDRPPAIPIDHTRKPGGELKRKSTISTIRSSLSLTSSAIKRKFVCVGEVYCGKTSMLLAYATGALARDYGPTIMDNYVTELAVDGKNYDLLLVDTPGQENYDRMRPICYSGTVNLAF